MVPLKVHGRRIVSVHTLVKFGPIHGHSLVPRLFVEKEAWAPD